MQDLSYPIVAIFLIGILIAISSAVAAWRVRQPLLRIMLIAVAAMFVLLPSWLMIAVHAPQWINARHRTYRAFYDDIKVGMSREQVLEMMEKHYPPGGPRQRPKLIDDEPTELGFLMTPETSRDPDAEGISVWIADGRVTRKFYSRD